jgi:threonine-phosphate decarboxylase
MTKFYGVPGLRLGYLLTSEELAARMKGFMPPWSVNTLAQIAGVYCLEQEAYRAETLRLVEAERQRMIERLKSLDGLDVLPGRANYLLALLPDGCPPAGSLQRDILLSDRILIRDCSSFEGLSDRYIRVAVRLPEQNERLLQALERCVKAHAS